MRVIFYYIFILIALTKFLFAQSELNHRWQKLENQAGEQIWFDAASIDSISGNKLEVWILQVHTPPMKSEGIDGEVYRSKILYAVNLSTARYGIMKLRYYDVKNKELYRFDYDTPPPPTDELKYPYPIFEESPIYLLIKILFANNDENGNR